MFVRLNLTVPPELVSPVREVMDDPRVIHVVHLKGVGAFGAADLIQGDVAREAASDLLDQLRTTGLNDLGGVTVTELDATLSRDARAAEKAAVGDDDDAVIWPVVLDRVREACDGSIIFYTFMVIATALAAIAVITDSPVLVVGAMVVSPDFTPVAGMTMGVISRDPGLIGKAAWLLVKSYGIAIAVVWLAALLAHLAGFVTTDMVTGPRPLTGFIWHPDPWSFVVALLAGAAGSLSDAAGKSQTMVGVFISVTTIPAAGNLALGLAVWAPHEIIGSGLQLLVNVAGMLIAGVVTLLVLTAAWNHVFTRERKRRWHRSQESGEVRL